MYEEVREMFSHDLFATKAAGVEIDELDKRYAKCSMKVTKDHLNANNVVMGGALFTLADFAFSVACNTDNAPTVSLNCSINYLSPAATDIVYATAKCIKDGRTTCVYSVAVEDANGKLVAVFTGTGYKTVQK